MVDLKTEGKPELVLEADFYSDARSLSSVFFAMFASKDGTVFGAINYTGLAPGNGQRFCEYNLAEEASLYEVYISVEGQIYKGCATIGNSRKH